MENSIKKLDSAEIEQLTKEIFDLANECAMHGWDYRPLLKANELLEQAYAPKTEMHYAQLIFQVTEYDGSRRTIYQRVEFIKSSQRLKAGELMSRKFAKAFLPEFFQKDTSSRLRLLSIIDASFIADDTDIFWDIDPILKTISESQNQ